MRIAIFTDYSLPHIGGVETSIYHQHKALTAAGHQVHVVSPPMKGAGKINDQAEDVIRVRSPINIHFDGMGVYLYNRDIFKQLDALKLDVIHFETEFNMAGLAIRYALSRKLPLVYTAHTFVTPQIEYLMKYPALMGKMSILAQRMALGKHLPKQNYEGVDGLFGIPCRTGAERDILNVWMKLAQLPDAIVGPSQRMVDYIGHYHPDKPRYVIPNPFESTVMADAPVEPVHHPIRVVSSFVMRPEKRPDVLIEAYRLLGPEEQAKLRIDMYGGGLLLNKMRGLVGKYKLQDKIKLHGSVPTDELHKAKLNSDVMVSTSYGFDNQPMMFLEALNAGCAILFCDGYLREGTDGGNSVLVDPTPEGFAKGLQQIIKSPSDISAMKKTSKHMAAKFNYQMYAKKYQKVLESLAATKK